MRHPVIARNYAEALLTLAEEAKDVERWGGLLDAVAGVLATDPTVHATMMSPRVPKAAKVRLLEQALAGTAPASFVRFLGSVVRRDRQGMLPEISEAYQEVADVHLGRVHASVTTARPVDPDLARAITEALTKAVGKVVVANYREDPAILGGVIVRVGDRAFDGSIRRRIQALRSRMLRGGKGAV